MSRTSAPRAFESLAAPEVAAFFRDAIADGPLTARPLPKLVERLARRPWAASTPVTATRAGFVLGAEGGPQVRVVYWQHIQTFQVWRVRPGAEALVVGQGTSAVLAETIVCGAMEAPPQV